jgi:hypothetical protein
MIKATNCPRRKPIQILIPPEALHGCCKGPLVGTKRDDSGEFLGKSFLDDIVRLEDMPMRSALPDFSLRSRPTPAMQANHVV